MVVWMADSWLIAAATSALIAVPCVVLVLPAAAVFVMVVTVSLSDSFPCSLSKTWYIVWLEYPFWPDVLRSANAVRWRPYALCMNVLRAG
jgi:hypothetical protein